MSRNKWLSETSQDGYKGDEYVCGSECLSVLRLLQWHILSQLQPRTIFLSEQTQLPLQIFSILPFLRTGARQDAVGTGPGVCPVMSASYGNDSRWRH